MIGKNIKIFEELDSTNNFVKMNVSNLDHGTVVVSKKQTNGRGRRDNVWLSEEGNLYMSILLKEDIYRDSIFKYIVKSSVAIIRTLGLFNINALIKYPNDCLIDNKKISGVLIESLGSKNLEFIIIGIGINVNQINFGKLDSKAISMKIHLKKNINVDDVLNKYIQIFNEILDVEFNELFAEYIKFSMVINKQINYKGENYIIKSIEQDGTIIIANDMSLERVAYSEISIKDIYQ